MLPTNIKKDKSLVCCKGCDGKGYIKKNIKLRIACGRCSGQGTVEWLGNLINKDKKVIINSTYSRDEIDYNILLLIKNLKELCNLADLKLEIKLNSGWNGDRTRYMEDRIREAYPTWYAKLKEK